MASSQKPKFAEAHIAILATLDDRQSPEEASTIYRSSKGSGVGLWRFLAMTARMSIETVTFHNRFRLPGMDRDHSPGVFEVQISEEPLNLMWEAYHRTMTLMLTSGGLVEAINVTAEDLEAALREDSHLNSP